MKKYFWNFWKCYFETTINS